MSGHSFLVDTNMLILLLNGNNRVAELLDGCRLYISFITELELLSAHGLQQNQIETIENLLADCIIVYINPSIKNATISIRSKNRIKLPDAIIAATATTLEIPLVTADKDFKSLEDLTLILFEL
jgi:hypothetical protein